MSENQTQRSGSHDQEHGKHRRKTPLEGFLSFFGTGIFSPKSMSYEPIRVLLNCPDKKECDRLTAQWRDHKLKELNFIGIVSALLTGCLTSTGSWPNILSSGIATPWGVRTCWYVGIVFGLASILLAADQTIRLHRLSSHQDAMSNIRHLLSSDTKDVDGKFKPRKWQVYTWQLPTTFLMFSVLVMMAGIWALIWTATLQPHENGWWDGNSIVAVIFTAIAASVILVFVAAQITLYSPTKELDDDDDNGD